MDYLALIEHGAALGFAIIGGASAICAMTKTPDPATPWGKVYHWIEVAGVIVGRVKDTGLVPADPAAEKIEAGVVEVAGELFGKTAPVLAALAIVGLSLTACSSAQLAAVQPYQDKIAAACKVALPLAPLAPPIAPWIIAGCGADSAIAALAKDPTSLAWVNGLIATAGDLI